MLLFLIVPIITRGEGRDPREEDGNDWISYKKNNVNIFYLIGFLAAVCVYQEKISTKDPDFEKLDLPDITVGQLKDGVDKFYEDFANRKIKIVDAIYIVKMQIEGENPELISAQIRYLRMQPTKKHSIGEIDKIFFQYLKNPKINIKQKYLDTGKFTRDDFLKEGLFIDEAGKLILLFRYGLYK